MTKSLVTDCTVECSVTRSRKLHQVCFPVWNWNKTNQVRSQKADQKQVSL